MGLLLFILIGFLAGLIARAILPGRQHMGILATTLVGMVGSIVGGLIGSAFSSDGHVLALEPSGILLSILGSIIVLLIWSAANGRRHRRVVI